MDVLEKLKAAVRHAADLTGEAGMTPRRAMQVFRDKRMDVCACELAIHVAAYKAICENDAGQDYAAFVQREVWRLLKDAGYDDNDVQELDRIEHAFEVVTLRAEKPELRAVP